MQAHLSFECVNRIIECKCEAVFSFKNQEAHESECPLIAIKCDMCSRNIVRRDIEIHRDECSISMTQCALCNTTMTRLKLACDHHCPERVIKCPRVCGDEFKASYLDIHLDTCYNRLIKCKYCKRDVSMLEIGRHVELCNKPKFSECKVGDYLIAFSSNISKMVTAWKLIQITAIDSECLQYHLCMWPSKFNGTIKKTDFDTSTRAVNNQDVMSSFGHIWREKDPSFEYFMEGRWEKLTFIRPYLSSENGKDVFRLLAMNDRQERLSVACVLHKDLIRWQDD
jgi:hypothetical protein